MKEGIKDLIDGISVYIDSKLNNIYSLNMMTGVVKEIHNKKYTVSINGKNYPNVVNINGFLTYKINDTVKVLCTKNKTKILEMAIIGKIGGNVDLGDITVNADIDASTATNGQVPTADGNGSWSWENQYSSSQISSYKNFGLAWICHTNDLKQGFEDNETAIEAFSKHDIIVTQTLKLDGLAPTSQDSSGVTPYTNDSNIIINGAKKINPKLRRVEYIQVESERQDIIVNGEVQPYYLNSDGSYEGSTAQQNGTSRIYNRQQFNDWLTYFKSIGADGVFLDDWGYDYTIEHICWQMGYNTSSFNNLSECMNKKFSDLIDDCHAKGLSVITNGRFTPQIGNYYTHFNENDIIAWESCMISSIPLGEFVNNQDSVYDYYTNYYLTNLSKAKMWCLDYVPDTADVNFLNKIRTYNISMALVVGAGYVSSGIRKCIEMPFYVESMTTESTRDIIKISNGFYQLKCGEHTLEVYRNPSLNGIITEDKLDECYCKYDGDTIKNAYLDAPITNQQMIDNDKELDEKINMALGDKRNNAPSYFKMLIDDWTDGGSVLSSYTNILNEDMTPDYGTSPTTIFEGDIFNFSVTFPESGWNGIKLFNFSSNQIAEYGLIGKTLEVGMKKFTATYEAYDGQYCLLRMKIGNNEPQYIKITGMGSSVLNDNLIGFSYKFTVPDNCTELIFEPWDAYLHSSSAGTVTCENCYLIDVNELSEDGNSTANWFTNLYNDNFNNSSYVLSDTQRGLKNGRLIFNTTFTIKDSWGWCAHEFTTEEVLNMRGKTYEFGCSEIIAEDGSSFGEWFNGGYCAFGIGIDSATDNGYGTFMPYPTTYRLFSSQKQKSNAWNEKLYCVRFTVPETATYLCFGFEAYNYPNNSIFTFKDVYFYELTEENIAVRGRDATNSTIRFCRVNEEIENETPTNLNNAIYFSDKGNIWGYDLSGEKVNFAESIFKGAVNAGYNGTAEQFGAELFALINNS